MAGRPPKPVALHRAQGNRSKLGAAELARREAAEVKPANASRFPPAWLTDPRAQGMFCKVSGYLARLGIWDAADADELARYCAAELAYELLTTRYLAAVSGGGAPEDAASLLAQQREMYRQAHTSASSLGLNVTSRCKVSLPRAAQGEKLEL